LTLLHEADALGAGLPPLLVQADHLAMNVSLGVHGRRKAGMGESFWQFRRHRPEDTYGAIDWRQSAKSQHLFVREREWEAAQSVWLWRDGSPGMRFGSADVTKIERANLLALALAALLVRGGERVALLGEGEAPAASRGALHRMAHRLLDGAPRPDSLPPDAPLARGARTVWFSDFLGAPEELEKSLLAFSRSGAGGHLVRIIDPAEEDFPYAGRTRFESPGGERSEIFGRAESVAPSYRARFRAHGEALAQLATRFGWTQMSHRTDHAPQAALIALHAALGGAIH
jgi:uncharacterized protein (DUF58 family)